LEGAEASRKCQNTVSYWPVMDDKCFGVTGWLEIVVIFGALVGRVKGREGQRFGSLAELRGDRDKSGVFWVCDDGHLQGRWAKCQ
jgi:hypothetical protein